MFKDYYKILGISSDSTLLEIKKAYRILALKWHPDKNPNKNTTQIFQLINEAYRILSDLEAKTRYDFEYNRYFEFLKQESNKTKFTQQKTEEKHKNNQNTSKESNNKNEEYEIFDKTLEKWMENARRQAREYVSEFTQDFVSLSKEASIGFFKDAGGMILFLMGISTLFFIIKFIINSL